MKKFLFLFLVTQASTILQAQVTYDSITLSRCTIENEYYEQSNWPKKLTTGEFNNYITSEKTIWVRSTSSKVLVKPAVLSLADRIKKNGTNDISKCFIPRHSINFYKQEKITRYLLVCFECDGIHFSDDPKKLFIQNIDTRDNQMLELKKLFKDLL